MYKGTILSRYSTFFIYTYNMVYGNIYNINNQSIWMDKR